MLTGIRIESASRPTKLSLAIITRAFAAGTGAAAAAVLATAGAPFHFIRRKARAYTLLPHHL
jgi:hypothetical protein